MSVAQLFETACHQPCPDMPFHSLNAAQKAKGLERLKLVRSELKEKQLVPLRAKREALAAKAHDEDTSAFERARISQEIRKIDSQAQRISERWS